MEILLYVLAGLFAIFAAIAIARFALGLAWTQAGAVLTTLVVAIALVPGAYAAAKAGQVLATAEASNDRQIDRARETIRKDILRRSDYYVKYPLETQRAVRIALYLA
ncbi:hypothetical protein [Croceicoccus gelatinilyticus]|uniref:hypothetical protein n=1 Tax=Croceicoccus gelatinilyticus TaxID=2835536 RepID=UPI001BCC5E83|nr:hypothetical protein [Croceicoccus gelatinilyticus]MBS7671390.1 hypothetical protein [Croceicoccus gelatinilyticus]